jgi:hypothetical protein
MPKIQLPPNIKKLKEQLETGHNLVDHFLVCGIPPSTCLQDFLYDQKNPKYTEIFKENIKPSIISRFPEFDNSIVSIDDEIINYCFPDGFEPVITTNPVMNSKYFSIILDNNLCSSEYPRKYLSCYLFYERLSAYKDLKTKLKNIEGVNEIGQENSEISDNEEKKETTNDDKDKEKENEKEVDNYLDSNEYKIYSSSICIKRSDNMRLSPSFTSVRTAKNTLLKRSSFLSDKGNIFIPKCICLVSIHPYIRLFHKILQDIHHYILEEKEIPIEKIITNLIIEVPIPPRGLYKINYILMNQTNVLEGSNNNKIQTTDVNLKKFNSCLDFKTKLEVIKHILLDTKILFFSLDIRKLCYSILSFLVLLFPFKYPFQVTSYLHKDNYNILESISPFILGIKEQYKESFFDENEIVIEGINIFIVDLDNKKSYLKSSEKFPNFPAKILSALEKEVKNLEYKYKKENDNSNIKEFNEQYQKVFFGFFCEILKGYDDYLNMDYFKSSDQDKVTSIETLFQCNKFIKTHSSSDIDFYNHFINDSQSFSDFIYKRMIPRNNQEIIDVLLVNETNLKMKNKSKIFGRDNNTDFLDSDDYNISNTYLVPDPRAVTNEEKKEILDKKDLLLTFGQSINVDKNNKLLFKYTLFPQLNFRIYCNNDNINEYIPPPDYSEEIEAINSDLLSKSSIGQNINLSLEMKNNIYLTWLEIWSYTFWYTDKEERKFRFNIMLDVLDKIIHHEMNIFNLMFDVLNQENEQKMIVKLYQKILQLKINPSTFIYNIISNRLDREQIQELFEQMKLGRVTNLKFEFNDKLKTRTFLSKKDKNSLIDNKISFDINFNCVDCMENINILKLCETFEGIKNDILWAPCINGHYNLPKIKVNFGLELFPLISNDNNTTTSIKNEIVLHSPYNLKINIKNAVNSQYGTKLKVNEFKSNFSPLFWNVIWYFSILNLNYEMILPYSKKIQQEKNNRTIINPNNERIKLLYNNDLYKENEEKINEINLGLIEEDSGNSLISIGNGFNDLEIINKISFEIKKIVKNKKVSNKFVDHKAFKKSNSMSEKGQSSLKLSIKSNNDNNNINIRGSLAISELNKNKNK